MERIGSGLREARLARGLSLRGLAQSLQVSASLISQIENGKTQPSVSTLYAMVTALGVSLDELLDVSAAVAAQTQQGSAVVQRAIDNQVLEMQNGVCWQRLAVGEGSTDALLATYEPGASSSIEGRLMQHVGVESAYILEGELTLQLESETHVLRVGDSLNFDSSRPHFYANLSDRLARGVWFVVGRREETRSLPAAAPHDPSSDAADREPRTVVF